VDYPPEVLTWFEELAKRPDLLPVVADWLQERDRCDASKQLSIGVRWALEKKRWPKQLSNTLRVTHPVFADRYHWSFTCDPVSPKHWRHVLRIDQLNSDPEFIADYRQWCSRRGIVILGRAERKAIPKTLPATLIETFHYLSMILLNISAEEAAE